MNIDKITKLIENLICEVKPNPWEGIHICTPMSMVSIRSGFDTKVEVQLYHSAFYKFFKGQDVTVSTDYDTESDYYFKPVNSVLFLCLRHKDIANTAIKKTGCPRTWTFKQVTLEDNEENERKWD